MKLLLPVLALLAGAPAAAQDAPCAKPAAVPGLAGWGKPAGDVLKVGGEAALTLKPAATVRFAPRLARPPKPGTYGGWFAFAVPAAGTYRVAVSERAWVDAVQGGKRLSSVAHAHGPECSGIAKIVSFPLAAGRAYLQLSEAEKPAIGVMLVKD